MERLNLKQYREMVSYILNYKKTNGKMPEYVMINEYKISKKEYIDMIERVNKFILEMGRNPRTVDIESPREYDLEDNLDY
jgi:lysine/ornithine N-monooxygenase